VTWISRPGSASTRICAVRRASHSPGGRDAVLYDEMLSFMTSLASTGTGRLIIGSRTTIAAMTQLLPYSVLVGPAAEPSCNQDAAYSFPRLRNKVSSIPTSLAVRRTPAARPPASPRPGPGHRGPSGRGRRTSAPGHRARSGSGPRRTVSRTPSTSRSARGNPQASTVKVRKDVAVNNGAKQASRLASEPGSVSVASGNISGNPFHQRFRLHR
jgi:hypothetical protein